MSSRKARRNWDSSQKWFETAIRARSRNVCEMKGCKEPAIHMHHITYENVPNEPLTDVLHLCWDCHSRAHGRDVSGSRGTFRTNIRAGDYRTEYRDRLRARLENR